MNTFSLQFENLLAARAGLRIRAQDRALVAQTIGVRAQSHQMSLACYLAFLQDHNSEEEWKKLFALLTNQESYFFRDEGQFALLRERILPELIAANRARRSLKLWSAGCSTGEEAYSLAMTLDQLLPFRPDWKIEIRASDLSEVALQKARAATYSAWSFRNTPQALRDRYFHRNGKNWILEKRLRDSVVFQHGNLLDDEYESHGISEIDLILCRNVFIYFEREAVAKVAKKMRNALRDGAYLIVGHAELHDVFLEDLNPQTFDQSVVYQRTSTRNSSNSNSSTRIKLPLIDQHAPPLPLPTSLPNSPLSNSPLSEMARVVISPQSVLPDAVSVKNPAPTSSETAATLRATPLYKNTDTSSRDTPKSLRSEDEQLAMVQRASAALRRGGKERGEERSEVLARLESLVQTEPRDALSSQAKSAIFGAHCLLAQEFANSARHEKSLSHCARALEIDALSPLIYHVEARIAADCGNQERAKELLKKVVYLAPQTVSALLELSAIYGREGDHSRAETWRKSALKALNEYSFEDLPQFLWSLDEPERVDALRAHLNEATTTQPTMTSTARFAARLENDL